MKRGRTNVDDARFPLFVTTTITEFVPVFRDQAIRCEVLRIIDAQRENFGMQIFAYVLMPSHIHLITQAPEKGATSRFVGAWKSLSAAAIIAASSDEQRRLILQAARKYGEPMRKSHKVWMSRFDDVALCFPDTFVTKLEYIHRNPVKAGLALEPREYRFSSAAYYSLGRPDAFIQLSDCRPLLAG